MTDEAKRDTTQNGDTTTKRDTSTTTTGGTKLTTDESQTSESKDAPFQGQRSTGGYVPT